jgi:hypothetical protein
LPHGQRLPLAGGAVKAESDKVFFWKIDAVRE